MARKFGIEIEFASRKSSYDVADDLRCILGRRYENGWIVKTDGSIRCLSSYIYSVEINTPILDTEITADLSDLKKVFEYCQTIGKINSSCGTHIHIDGRGFNIVQLKRVIKFYSRYEAVIQKLVSPSRRGNRYCQLWRNVLGLSIDNLIRTSSTRALKRAWESAGIFGPGNPHYRFLNLTSWYIRGSFEIRGHQGTLNYYKIMEWVQFWVKIIDYLVDHDVGYINYQDLTNTYQKVAEGTFADWNVDFKKMATRIELNSEMRRRLERRAATYAYSFRNQD